MPFLVILGWILISIVIIFVLLLAVIGALFMYYMFVREGAEGPKIWREAMDEHKN